MTKIENPRPFTLEESKAAAATIKVNDAGIAAFVKDEYLN